MAEGGSAVRTSRRIHLLVAAAAGALPLPLAGAQARSLATTVSVAVNGDGSVTGPGIECRAPVWDCKETFAPGTSVPLTATPSAKTLFAGWAGTCSGRGNLCTLTVGDDGAAVVSAVFAYVEVIDVNKTGSGDGVVRSNPAGIDCGKACTRAFSGDTKITLTAIPRRGSVFAGWQGWCSGTGPCTIGITYGSAPVEARFEKVGAQPFWVTGLGASASSDAKGRLITVRLRTTRAARIDVATYYRRKLVVRSLVSASPGTVTVRVPMPAWAPAGAYTIVATLRDASGAKRVARFGVVLPKPRR